MGKAGIAVVVALALCCVASVRAVCPSLGERINGIQYFYGDGDLSTDACNFNLDGVESVHFLNGTLTIFSFSPFYQVANDVKEITFEEETSVTVYASAFSSPNLEYVTFRGSVNVSRGMFYGCHKLHTISLPKSFDFVYDPGSLCSSSSGEGCENLQYINIDGGDGDHYWVVNYCLYTSGGKRLIQCPFYKPFPVKSFTTTETCEVVGSDAIGEYCPIEELTLAASVKSIGTAFEYCNQLKSVKYLGVDVPTEQCSFGSSSELSCVCVPSGYKGDEYCKKPARDCDHSSSSGGHASHSSGGPAPPPPPAPTPSSSSLVVPSLSLQLFVALASLFVVVFVMLQ